jgi:hypothetical protein
MGILTIPRVEFEIELYSSSFVAMRKAYVRSGEEDMIDDNHVNEICSAQRH